MRSKPAFVQPELFLVRSRFLLPGLRVRMTVVAVPASEANFDNSNGASAKDKEAPED